MKIIVFFLAIVICGRATELSRTPPGPLGYREAFRDGCDSGYVAAGHPYYQWHKEVEREMADMLYASGWRDGYDRCKTSYSNLR